MKRQLPSGAISIVPVMKAEDSIGWAPEVAYETVTSGRGTSGGEFLDPAIDPKRDLFCRGSSQDVVKQSPARHRIDLEAVGALSPREIGKARGRINEPAGANRAEMRAAQKERFDLRHVHRHLAEPDDMGAQG